MFTDAAYTWVPAFVGLFHTVFVQVFLAPSIYTIISDAFRDRLIGNTVLVSSDTCSAMPPG